MKSTLRGVFSMLTSVNDFLSKMVMKLFFLQEKVVYT